MKKFFCFLILILSLSFVYSININSCGTLNQAGATYDLTADVSSTGTCFTITEDNITLNLNGHTVTYADVSFEQVYNGGFETAGANSTLADGWTFSDSHAERYAGSYYPPDPFSNASNPTLFDGSHSIRINSSGAPNSIQITSTVPITLEPGIDYIASAMFNNFQADSADARIDVLNSSNQIIATSEYYQSGTSITNRGFHFFPAADSGYVFSVSTPTEAYLRITVSNLSYESGPVYIDYVRLLAANYRGITTNEIAGYGGEYTKNGLTITNGSIIQGNMDCYFCHSIASKLRNAEVSYINARMGGVESSAIYAFGGASTSNCYGSNIHHNTFTHHNYNVTDFTQNPEDIVIRRDNMYALIECIGGGGNTTINDNQILGSPQIGILFDRAYNDSSTPINIYNNTIKHNSKYTQAFAMQFYDVKYTDIYNNTIDLTSGRGIHIEHDNSTNITIRDNTVKVKEQRNQEQGFNKTAYGIQAEGGNNYYIYNNYVEARTHSNHGNGIGLRISNPVGYTEVHDNVFVGINENNPNYFATPFYAAATSGSNVQMQNNTFKSNDIMFYFAGGDNFTFENSTIEKLTSPYDLYSYTVHVFNRYGDSLNNRFLNNILLNGAQFGEAYDYFSETGSYSYSCTTSQSCPGLISCNNSGCGSCIDISGDSCPGSCTTGQTQSCTTTYGCPGTQTCTSGVWGNCTDDSGDTCPTCPQGQITYSCFCGGTQYSSGYCCSGNYQTTSCPVCSDGQTQSCTTTEACPGTQTCSGGAWGSCSDTPNDNCPGDAVNWVLRYQENFDSVSSLTNNTAFGTDSWLTPHLVNNGSISINNQEAVFSTPNFNDAALIRTTNILPSQYKIRVKVGQVDYDIGNYEQADYDNPAFNDHSGYYENGFYWLVISDGICSGIQCAEDWWHWHRKVNMDSDDHLEYGTGAHIQTPFYMVYMAPETNSGGNLLRTWANGVWNTFSWNWEIAYVYNPLLWYYVELEKANNQVILRLYDESLNLIEETDSVSLDLINAMDDSTEYLYIGEPHSDDYEGTARVDEITLWVPDTATECTNGTTRNCTTTENCPGTQTCINNTWQTCEDISGDNCPTTANPTINVSQVNPQADISVEYGTAFTFSTSITCDNSDCGNIQAILDPEISTIISQGTDDAWIYGTTINTTHDLGVIGNSNGTPNEMAFRFNNLNVPAGAVINSASIQLTSRFDDTENTVNLIIRSQTDDSPLAFSTYTDYSSRTKSNSSIEWNSLAGFAYLQTYNTPDLSPIIQEVINKNYWQEGDSIVIFIEDNGSTSNARRRIIQYDSPWFPDNQAMLTVNYSEGNTKGQVSTTIGAQPFYTTSLNPQTCSNMTAGETCTNSWQVIPTGTIGETYTFFVDYIPENTEIQSKQTTPISITITEQATCTESWSCTAWSTCENGTQTRTCTDNNDCGTTNNKPTETQTCFECTSGETRNCTTLLGNPGTQTCTLEGQWGTCQGECTNGTTRACLIDGSSGTQTCTNEQWGSCIKDIFSCSQGIITEECYCGELDNPDDLYSSGYCCAGNWRNTPCPTNCPQGEITEECYCGTETYTTGYCCEDIHQTASCTCDENWSCTTWSTCMDGNQTRTCTDNSNCGTQENKPQETQFCGECIEGEIQYCTTNQGCQGTQECRNGKWKSCQDVPEDNCPAQDTNLPPGQLKQLSVQTDNPELVDGQAFTLIVTNDEPLHNAKVVYAEKIYWTDSTGQVKLKAITGFDLIKVSKTGYYTETIKLNFKEIVCGDNICETGFENETNCPTDCKQPEKLKELKMYTFKTEDRLVIKVTDSEENPLGNVRVNYGTENKYTNTQGLVDFTELIQPQLITAEKPGYKTTQKTHNPTTTCIENTIKNCKTEGCPGTQTCTNGTWTNCIDNPNDNCPQEETVDATTTTALAIILVIGIILFIITKISSA